MMVRDVSAKGGGHDSGSARTAAHGDGPTHAMILAAGFGTRLRPLTDTLPKPLVPVCERPLISYAFAQLQPTAVQQVVVNVSYRAPQLEAYLQACHVPPPQVHLSQEPQPLETGGGIVQALPHLGRNAFFVMNSDVICLEGSRAILPHLWSCWDDEEMDILLLLVPLSHAMGYEGEGDFYCLPEGTLRRVTEGEAPGSGTSKQRSASRHDPYVFTGIQLMHPRALAQEVPGKFSLNRVYDRYLGSDEGASRMRGVVHDGMWLHVGDPAALAAAEAYLRRADSALQHEVHEA